MLFMDISFLSLFCGIEQVPSSYSDVPFVYASVDGQMNGNYWVYREVNN